MRYHKIGKRSEGMEKNFKKKCLVWVTAVVLILVAIPVAGMSGVVPVAGDENIVTIDNIDYTISNGVAEVKSCDNAGGAVVIPDAITYEGVDYDVTSISSAAFQYNYHGNENIVSVSIGNNVTTIKDGTFCYCISLKSVELSEGITYIGENAFSMCHVLESIKLPDSVKYIGRHAFMDCWNMTSIYIPSGVESIGEAIFDGCRSLTNITIPCDFNKDLFLQQDSSSSIGTCIIVSEDAPDSYKIIQSKYYDELQKDMYEEDMFIATGTFTYTHDIKYKTDGDKITASCKNCDVEYGSVTLVAPTELEYTSNAITATLSGKITGVLAPTINYVAAEGSKLTDGKPVEPGTYMASITMGGKTVSVEYTILGETTSSSDDNDDSDDDTDTASSSSAQVLNVASDNVVASDAPVEDVALENSTEELLGSSIFTTAEKRQIANGSSAKVYVGIDSLPAENVPQADRNAIESEATASLGTNFAIQYMDMSLFKQIGSAASQKVSEPGVGIKVTVELPSNLINRNAGVSRRYVVIRLHDGVVTTLETTFDNATNKLAFSTDRFSTYAIAYTDEAVATGNLTDASSPKTGDTANIPAMLVLMAVAGMMVCLAYHMYGNYTRRR
jgi:hypothetical protein